MRFLAYLYAALLALALLAAAHEAFRYVEQLAQVFP